MTILSLEKDQDNPKPEIGRFELRKNCETYAANRDVLLTRLLENLGDDTLLLELEIHLGLVGLNLYKNITGGNRVTSLPLPGADIASGHGGRQGRHLDDLMLGEGGIASHNVRSEASSQGIVRRGEGTPSERGAEHCEE